jgi:hypothetical protein
MRITSLAIVLPWLVGCAATRPFPTAQVELPYSACEPMPNLRSNLTGTPYPSPKSDAVLRKLGVRCIARGYPYVSHAGY